MRDVAWGRVRFPRLAIEVTIEALISGALAIPKIGAIHEG